MQIPSALTRTRLRRGLGNLAFALFIKKSNHNRWHQFTNIANSLVLPGEKELACECAVRNLRARPSRSQTSQSLNLQEASQKPSSG